MLNRRARRAPCWWDLGSTISNVLLKTLVTGHPSPTYLSRRAKLLRKMLSASTLDSHTSCLSSCSCEVLPAPRWCSKRKKKKKRKRKRKYKAENIHRFVLLTSGVLTINLAVNRLGTYVKAEYKYCSRFYGVSAFGRRYPLLYSYPSLPESLKSNSLSWSSQLLPYPRSGDRHKRTVNPVQHMDFTSSELNGLQPCTHCIQLLRQYWLDVEL
jgi:hypothetical protein